MPNLTPLATRLEEAEASRELEAELNIALGWKAGRGWKKDPAYPYTYRHHMGGFTSAYPAERWTESLDAALRLVGAKLPGWAWSVGNLSTGGQAYLMRAESAKLIGAHAKTPALALLAALLKALAQSPAIVKGEER